MTPTSTGGSRRTEPGTAAEARIPAQRRSDSPIPRPRSTTQRGSDTPIPIPAQRPSTETAARRGSDTPIPAQRPSTPAPARRGAETPTGPAQRRSEPLVPEQRAPEAPLPPRTPEVDEAPGADGPTGPISAVALLRREGIRVPHAAERPLRPRSHQRTPEPSDSWLSSVMVRRAGAAAGALVAAASVFSTAVLTDVGAGPARVTVPGGTTPATPDGAPGAELPGLALLGPIPPGSDVAVDGPVSLASFDDPGSAPGSFLTPSVPGATGAPAPADAASGTPGDTGGSRESGSGPAQRVLGGVTGPVQGVTDSVGEAAPGPVGDTVSGLGDAVHDTGQSLGGAVDGLLGGGNDRRTSSSPSSDVGGRDPALSSLDSGGGGLVGTVGRTASGLLGG